MKSLCKTFSKLAGLALFSMITFAGAAATASAQDGRIETAKLEYLAEKASQTVDVNIDERLIQLAAKFLDTKDRDEASVKQLVNGLKGIYVKSFEFELENQYTAADVEAIRSQVKNAPWSRIVGVRSKKEGSLEVYILVNGTQVGGMAVLATDPKEITIVNIVGPVDLEKLTQLEGQFGIPDLEIEKPKAKTKKTE